MKPRVSVLLPVYNGEQHLQAAIDSLLAQEMGDFELLIVDDASSDGTRDILAGQKDSRIRSWRHSDNQGLVFTLNELLRAASSDIVARQDHDDWSDPKRLCCQLDLIEKETDLSAVFCDAQLVDGSGRYCGRMRTPSSPEAVRWDLCFRNPFPHSGAMFRRPEALRHGGYHDLPACEDYDLWSRFARNGKVRSIAAALVKYRIHEASIMGRENRNVSQKHLDARRSIARENIRFIAGSSICPEDEEVLLDAWQEEKSPDWRHYFRIRERMSARHSGSMESLIADEDYTLFCRLWGGQREEVRPFLYELAHSDFRRVVRLPWIRMAVMMLRR